jgi:hypothetical protein
MVRKRGSNHIQYIGDGVSLRLTSNIPTTTVIEENYFFVDSPLTMLLGPDETVSEGVLELGRHMLEETVDYWRTWVRALAIPFEWQDAVIQAERVRGHRRNHRGRNDVNS